MIRATNDHFCSLRHVMREGDGLRDDVLVRRFTHSLACLLRDLRLALVLKPVRRPVRVSDERCSLRECAFSCVRRIDFFPSLRTVPSPHLERKLTDSVQTSLRTSFCIEVLPLSSTNHQLQLPRQHAMFPHNLHPLLALLLLSLPSFTKKRKHQAEIPAQPPQTTCAVENLRQ